MFFPPLSLIASFPPFAHVACFTTLGTVACFPRSGFAASFRVLCIMQLNVFLLKRPL